VTEVLLRRSLPGALQADSPQSIISVCEVHRESDWEPARDLLLEHLPREVSGASEHGPDCEHGLDSKRWLESLWAGTTPAHCTADCDSTWVFSAKDRLDKNRAAAIGTSKKGGAVKIMPIAAADIEAFRAMVIDLPALLSNKGRKCYLHIAPDADQVAALQEAGWTFEALLPAAYSNDIVTQQWGCQLGKDTSVANLRIHHRFLELIKCGEKTLEIRVGYDHIKRIRPGDTLRLFSGTDPSPFEVTVADVRNYRSFVDLLDHEDITKALPGMTKEEALLQLRKIYPADKEKRGVLVLDLKASTAQ
jgi:ASC-1-like (ASCH) protein